MVLVGLNAHGDRLGFVAVGDSAWLWSLWLIAKAIPVPVPVTGGSF